MSQRPGPETGVLIRPMRPEDLVSAERITADSYLQADLEYAARSPAPTRRTQVGGQRWRERTAHLLASDPQGCWVAERDAELVGVVVSFRRELMWLLASFAVAPHAQGNGVGTRLLERAVEYGSGCLRGMFNSSADPAALRRYRRAGFDLQPYCMATGTIDRARFPDDLTRILGSIRAGDAADRHLLDSLDRRTRGAAHGPDHEVLAKQHPLIVCDRLDAQGYAYLGADGSPAVLAATDRRTATRLLWGCLATAQDGSQVRIDRISAANQWALDVALDAGLAIGQHGFLALRRLTPPAPYLPHASLM